MASPGPGARKALANKLALALEALDSGRVRVVGDGHSVEASKARLEQRIRELDPETLARRAGRSTSSNGAGTVVPIRRRHPRRRVI